MKTDNPIERIVDWLEHARRHEPEDAEAMSVATVDAAGQPMPAPVELGALAGNDVIVTAGLTAGARVIVDGLLKVRPGSPVNPVPIAEGTARNSEPSSVQ